MSSPTFLTESLPRAHKRNAARTAMPQAPAKFRVVGVDLEPEERAVIRQRLGAKLSKYQGDIERVSVRVRDDNGPRGGVDKVCQIKVVLRGLPSLVYESRAALLSDALNGALAGTQRAVGRSLQRRLTQSIEAMASGTGAPRHDDSSSQEP